MKMRLFEIAAELHVDSATLLNLLRDLGYPVSGMTSILDESEAAEVLRKIGSLRKTSREDDQFRDQTVPGEVPRKVSRCLRCGKKLGVLSKRFRCTMCGAICCKECRRFVPEQIEEIGVSVFEYPPQTVICVTCFQEAIPLAEEKMAAARAGASRVDTWPASYRGQIPVDTSKPRHQIESRRYGDKQLALNALKVTAAFLECDVVYEVRYEKETRSESGAGDEKPAAGPVWRASGIAGRRRLA